MKGVLTLFVCQQALHNRCRSIGLTSKDVLDLTSMFSGLYCVLILSGPFDCTVDMFSRIKEL